MKLPWKPWPADDPQLIRYYQERHTKPVALQRWHLHRTRTRKGEFYHLTETKYRPILRAMDRLRELDRKARLR